MTSVRQAIAQGQISRTLPFVRREAVRLLKQAYPSHEAADFAINRVEHPAVLASGQPALAGAIVAVQRLYGRNVFPTMKVSWGGYANNIGHVDFPGGFRCHDDSYKAKDGTTISEDCSTCHTLE